MRATLVSGLVPIRRDRERMQCWGTKTRITARAEALVALVSALLGSGPLHAQAGGAIGGVVGGAVGRLVGKGAADGTFSDWQLRSAAEQVNRYLPKMVDKSTRLDRVAAESNKRMVFLNTLTAQRGSEIDLGRFYGEFAARIKSSACANADTLRMLNGGVSMVWTYKALDGQQVGSVSVASQDCGQQTARPAAFEATNAVSNPPPRMTIAEARRRLPALAAQDDDSFVRSVQELYYPDIPVEQIANDLGVQLHPKWVPKQLGAIDRWRYDACLKEAANAPTSRGVNLAASVCDRKFEQMAP